MKEQLYTIPVNDIYNNPCECPVCAIRLSLDQDGVDFAMGSSYMQDDIRAETDKIGFCTKHMRMMYKNGNRLGLALMLDTHLQYINRNVEEMQKLRHFTGGLFSKKEDGKIYKFTQHIANSCYICDRIGHTFDRYVATIFYLYKNDSAFVKKFNSGLGYCVEHYGLLYNTAPKYLSGSNLEAFIKALDRIFLENMKRMEADVSWFIDKFDYRNSDAPWKTSKDALPRAMTKCNSILDELPEPKSQENPSPSESNTQ